jgi:protein SCO1/2
LNKKLILALLSVGLFSLGMTLFAASRLGYIGGPEFYGTVYEDTPPAPDFALTDQHGNAVSLADFRDRTLLLFFGFTRCPDVCPLTLDQITRVLRDAGIGPDRVAVALITVDPEYDTPERIGEYLARFGDAVVGLTADRATLEPIYAEYGIYAQETPGHDGESVLAHTWQVFGIDTAGRLRVLIHPGDSDETVESDIRALMKSGT